MSFCVFWCIYWRWLIPLHATLNMLKLTKAASIKKITVFSFSYVILFLQLISQEIFFLFLGEIIWPEYYTCKTLNRVIEEAAASLPTKESQLGTRFEQLIFRWLIFPWNLRTGLSVLNYHQSYHNLCYGSYKHSR